MSKKDIEKQIRERIPTIGHLLYYQKQEPTMDTLTEMARLYSDIYHYIKQVDGWDAITLFKLIETYDKEPYPKA